MHKYSQTKRTNLLNTEELNWELNVILGKLAKQNSRFIKTIILELK